MCKNRSECRQYFEASDSKASDPGDEQPSAATTDGSEVDSELPAGDQADSNSTDEPDTNETDQPDPDIDISAANVPEGKSERRGKLKGKIRSHNGQPTV